MAKNTEPNPELVAICQRLLVVEDALKQMDHAVERVELSQPLELKAVETRPQFVCLPDGTRISLAHLESFKPYGARGISFRLNSGAVIQWEASAQGTTAKQEKERQGWLASLGDAVRVSKAW